MADACRAMLDDLCGMHQRLQRLANGEVLQLAGRETDQVLAAVDELADDVSSATEPAADLKAWTMLLVGLTDQLANAPADPASPRDRVMLTMLGKAATAASTALQQIVSRCRRESATDHDW